MYSFIFTRIATDEHLMLNSQNSHTNVLRMYYSSLSANVNGLNCW